jgi:hypothetical protein
VFFAQVMANQYLDYLLQEIALAFHQARHIGPGEQQSV